MKRPVSRSPSSSAPDSPLAAGIPESIDAASYKRLSPSLAVSGKPSKEALASLKASGFRTVIDLRQPGEGVARRETVEAQGLTFVSVPVSPDTFSAGDVKKVGAVLKDQTAAPVLLFCASSNRVGAVMAVIEYGTRAFEGRGDRRRKEGRPEERRDGEGGGKTHRRRAAKAAAGN